MVTGFCELTTSLGKLHRAVEVWVSPRALLFRANTTCCKGAAREALAALLKRTISAI